MVMTKKKAVKILVEMLVWPVICFCMAVIFVSMVSFAKWEFILWDDKPMILIRAAVLFGAVLSTCRTIGMIRHDKF